MSIDVDRKELGLLWEIIEENLEDLTQSLDEAFREHQMFWNILTTIIYMVAADVVVQMLKENHGQFVMIQEQGGAMDQPHRGDGENMDNVAWNYNYARSGRIAIIAVFNGLATHGWYKFLERRYSKADASSVVIKLLLDQGVAAPLYGSYYITALEVLQGRIGLRSISNAIKTKLPNILTADILFWPPVQVINFAIVPSHFRVFYVNIMAFIWNILLNIIMHRLEMEQALAQQQQQQ